MLAELLFANGSVAHVRVSTALPRKYWYPLAPKLSLKEPALPSRGPVWDHVEFVFMGVIHGKALYMQAVDLPHARV